jgi:hypothetical protein
VCVCVCVCVCVFSGVEGYVCMCKKRVMFVVPLLNSSLCYISFMLFMCFFFCLKQKRK